MRKSNLAVMMVFILFSFTAFAQDDEKSDGKNGNVRVVYPKKSKVDFEGLAIEGELKNPAEFYFQHRKQEKFDSLVKRRPNFHHEMLRDVVLVK